MFRGRVGPSVVRARGRSSNHGDVGGTQKETLVEVQRDAEVGTKRRSQTRNVNMIQKVEGPWENYHGSS